MKYQTFLLIGAITILSCACTPKKNECIDEHVVKEIVELKYRDADIKLDDNSIMTVNQATLKPGDKICKKFKY